MSRTPQAVLDKSARHSNARTRVWAGIVAVGLAASSCGADDEGSAATTDPPAADTTEIPGGAEDSVTTTITTTESVPPEPQNEEPENGESVSETTDAASVADLGVDPCILGVWRLDNESFAEAMETLSAAAALPLDVEISGDDYARFTATPGDDEPVLAFSSRRVDFTMALSTSAGTANFLLNSEEAATFGAATPADGVAGSGVFWLTDTMTVSESAEMTANGVSIVLESDQSGSFDVFGYTGELPPTVPEEFDGVAGYECRPGELLITSSPDLTEFDEEDVDLAALPQFLTVRFTASSWPAD
jgi:hypothetical protein